MKGRKFSTSHHLTGLPACNPPSDDDSGSSKEQDRFLPIANVSRIMKRSLPSNAKISKEAKESVQECVSEFISFITGEAFDKCQREKRKTINGDDLLWAMTTLGFDSYVPPLKTYLSRYKDSEGEKNTIARQQPAAVAAGDCDHHSMNHEEKSGSGFYVVPPSFGGGHGFFGRTVGRVHDEGGHGGGRGTLQGNLSGVHW